MAVTASVAALSHRDVPDSSEAILGTAEVAVMPSVEAVFQSEVLACTCLKSFDRVTASIAIWPKAFVASPCAVNARLLTYKPQSPL